MKRTILACLPLLAITAIVNADDRTPHELEGGERARFEQGSVSVDPITMGPATVRAPVRLGPGVVATRTADGLVVSCEPASTEVLRLREQLRLRGAELAVVRSQLKAAEHRAKRP